MFVKSHQSNKNGAIQRYILQNLDHFLLDRFYLFFKNAQIDNKKKTFITRSRHSRFLLGCRHILIPTVINLEFEGRVLRHELVGQLLRRDRLGIIGRQGRHTATKATSDRLQIIINLRILTKHSLTGAHKGQILQPGNIGILEGRIMECRMNDATLLLDLCVGGYVPDKPD